MNVLITGAGGFIGQHLAQALIEKGHRVRGLLLPQENAVPLEKLGVEVVRGNLTQPESLQGVARGVDTVYHLAARTSDWGTYRQFAAIMVDGTRHLLEASQGQVSRFVYCSSLAALGLGRPLVGLNEQDPRKHCGIPYCDTKIAAEKLVADFCSQHAIEHTIVRPANVIGPGSVWVREIIAAYQRGAFPLINGGRAPGAFVYVDNLIDGMVLAGRSPRAAGQTYHFRDDYTLSWRDYLTTLGRWIDKSPKGNLPFLVAWHMGALCEAVLIPFGIRPPLTRLAAGIMGLNNDIDNSLARQQLGWQSRISQEEAMARIQQWVTVHHLA